MWEYVPVVSGAVALHVALVAACIVWVLATKKDATAALAWCLLVIFLPISGPLMFWFFGYNHITRPLRRKKAHRRAYRAKHRPENPEAARGHEKTDDDRQAETARSETVGQDHLAQAGKGASPDGAGGHEPGHRRDHRRTGSALASADDVAGGHQQSGQCDHISHGP